MSNPADKSRPDCVGERCKFPYTQLRGDSLTFDFSKYPCEAYFVDGAHDKEHVKHETKEVLKLKPAIVIYHDADMLEVLDGIVDCMNKNYQLFRVEDTRIAYLLKK